MSATDDKAPVDQDACHCTHLAIVLHDFKRIEKVAWMLIAGIGAVLGKEAWSAMSSHERAATPPAQYGERLFEDRTDRTERRP